MFTDIKIEQERAFGLITTRAVKALGRNETHMKMVVNEDFHRDPLRQQKIIISSLLCIKDNITLRFPGIN